MLEYLLSYLDRCVKAVVQPMKALSIQAMCTHRSCVCVEVVFWESIKNVS